MIPIRFGSACMLACTLVTTAGTARVPCEVLSHVVYMKVRVNGSAPVWFALDSGASRCVIDTGFARELGLATEAGPEIRGAGAGTVPTATARDVHVEVGDASFVSPAPYVIDLSGDIGLDRPVRGLLGSDFFERFVVDCDYENGRLALHEPHGYSYAGRGTAIPIRRDRGLIYVTATIHVAGVAPASREFLVDSGSSDAVDDDLIASSTAPRRDVEAGSGLGARFRATFGRIDLLRLGPFEIADAPGVAGGRSLVGGAVLSRFRVIFDYARSRLILEPNGTYETPFAVLAPDASPDARRGWTSAPCMIDAKLVYVATRVNGSEPLRFVLASGSSRSALDLRTAEALGLAGGASVTNRPVILDIAGVSAEVGRCQTADLSWFATDEGVSIAGVIGCDVLRQYVVAIDYDASVIRVASPDFAASLEGATVVPLAFEQGVPIARAVLKLRGTAALVRCYRVDTGSEGALSDDLFARMRSRTVPFLPSGQGRDAPPAVLARAEWLNLGGLVLRDVNGVTGGAAIGGEILHRFAVTLDLPHRRLVLRPNRYLGEAWVFDMSGLDLAWNDDRTAFVVRSVAAGTPGAEAGLRSGDLVTAVDGAPASAYGLNQVRRMLHEATTYDLDVRRGNVFRARLRLHPLL